MHRIKTTIVLCLLAYLYAPSDRPCMHGDEPLRLAHRWEVEPDLGIEWLLQTPDPVVRLRPEDFNSTEQQVLLDAARFASQWAHLENLSGREESRGPLLEQLKKKPSNRHLRLALAAAAIALCDVSQAAELWVLLNDDSATRPVVERALIAWHSPVALEVWRGRLSQADASLADLRLAIEGVAACGNSQDRPALEALLRSDRMPTPMQALIAHALGELVNSGLEELALQVMASDVPHRQLLTAELMSSHTSSAAQALLQSIVDSDHDPARNVAYAAIAQNYPQLARELAPTMLQQADNNLRSRAIEELDRHGDSESLRIQAQAISDRNYELRVTVRKHLERKAEIPELLTVVNAVIDQQFTEGIPRGIEQALQLAVALEHRERCPQYVKLLEHPSPEVALLAAWALQEFADQPELMAAMLAHVQPLTERLSAREQTIFPEHLRQAFLFESFGRNRYQPALEILKRYIPKQHYMGDFNRASAIWALGKILEGTKDEVVAKDLIERMLDTSNTDPEDPLVQFSATVAIGWIDAPGSLEKVKQLRDKSASPLGTAGHWAQQQLQASKP